MNYLQRRNELTFQDVKFHARNKCVRFGRPGVTGAIEKVKMIAAALLLRPRSAPYFTVFTQLKLLIHHGKGNFLYAL